MHFLILIIDQHNKEHRLIVAFEEQDLIEEKVTEYEFYLGITAKSVIVYQQVNI